MDSAVLADHRIKSKERKLEQNISGHKGDSYTYQCWDAWNGTEKNFTKSLRKLKFRGKFETFLMMVLIKSSRILKKFAIT